MVPEINTQNQIVVCLRGCVVACSLDITRFPSLRPRVWSATQPRPEFDTELPLPASSAALQRQRKWAGPGWSLPRRRAVTIYLLLMTPGRSYAQWQITLMRTHTHTHTDHCGEAPGSTEKHTFVWGYPKMAKLINACVKNEAQICVREVLACVHAAASHVFRQAHWWHA